MKRSNHYEAAFEAYLQWQRLCYVAVDETRRSMLGESRVKSLDFIVHGDGGARLLVENGQQVQPGQVLCKWDPHTTPIVAEFTKIRSGSVAASTVPQAVLTKQGETSSAAASAPKKIGE